MLISNISVDDDAWLFETTRKKDYSVTELGPQDSWVMMVHSTLNPPPPKKNHSVTAISAHILLGSNSLQFQHKNRTNRPSQKLPPPGK